MTNVYPLKIDLLCSLLEILYCSLIGHALSLDNNNSWGRQSNAFERSMPTMAACPYCPKQSLIPQVDVVTQSGSYSACDTLINKVIIYAKHYVVTTTRAGISFCFSQLKSQYIYTPEISSRPGCEATSMSPSSISSRVQFISMMAGEKTSLFRFM